MLVKTNLIDIEKQKQLEKKVVRLCKLYNCTKVDLLIMSIDAQKKLNGVKNEK